MVQLILVSNPEDRAARDAIDRLQSVGRAQKAYFDAAGDIETSMMDK